LTLFTYGARQNGVLSIRRGEGEVLITIRIMPATVKHCIPSGIQNNVVDTDGERGTRFQNIS